MTYRPCPVRVSAYTATYALGVGQKPHLDAVVHGRSGLRRLGPHDFGVAPLPQALHTWVGRVTRLDEPLPDPWSHWDCRNNLLAWLGLQGDGFMTAVRSAAEKHSAVVGGVDSLCGSVVFGCHALQLVSAEPCQPFDTRRSGINLGEAAAFALLERAPDGLQLLGSGESSNAHHLSAPMARARRPRSNTACCRAR